MTTPIDMTDVIAAYRDCLADYLRSRGEAALYKASLLGQTLVERGLGPEDLVAVHVEALECAVGGLTPRQVAGAGVDGLLFLLEVMIAYGVQFQQAVELRLAEQARQAEESHLRAQALEQSSRMHADVLATVSHELRTPVTVAQGSLDMVARHVARQQIESVPPFIESARQALTRLSRLTADLYEASRGSAPQLQQGPQNLAVIVARAREWAEEPAAQRGIVSVFDPGSDELPVLGDEEALLSVLGNLVSNAIRYTPAGGRVTIRTGGDDARVWVEVIDTGIGMSPEVQDHIFERFYRAPEARTVESQGLGLGLALAHQLVQAHEGQLTITSAAGDGSSFRLTLPRLSGQPRSPTDTDLEGVPLP